MARMTATLRVHNAKPKTRATRNSNEETVLVTARIPRKLHNDLKVVGEEYGATLTWLMTDILTNGVREYIEGKTQVAELSAACETFFSRYANGKRRDGIREAAARLIMVLVGLTDSEEVDDDDE